LNSSNLLNIIDKAALPVHIAITMDGNGRWAKQKGFQRVFGHKNAIEAVRDTTEACAELGVDYLTLYTFSSENWNRPQKEVTALMELLKMTIKSETKTLLDNDIRFNTIGEIDRLPESSRKLVDETMALTKDNKRMTLTLALSYGGRQEIIEAIKAVNSAINHNNLALNELNEERFSQYLNTAGMPDPELMIRTGGEHRVSNFLMWQMAYAELYFTDVLWPDFRRQHLYSAIADFQRRQHLYSAIADFQQRERRFGKTSEQVSA